MFFSDGVVFNLGVTDFAGVAVLVLMVGLVATILFSIDGVFSSVFFLPPIQSEVELNSVRP